MVKHDLLHCLRTRGDSLRLHSEIIQHTHAGFQTQFIIIGHQHIQIDEFIIVDIGGILKLQVNGDCEAGANSGLAFDLDISSHHPDDIPADGHAETGTLDPVDPSVLCPDKRFKNPIDERFAHPDTVILKDKFITPDLRLIGRPFRDGKPDLSAIRCKLHGISHEISKDLLYPETVPHHCLIDQSEQMLACPGNLLQTVLNPLFIVNMGRSNGCHADDPIHRRADVMGHIGQEISLCLVFRLRRVKGRLQIDNSAV